MQPGAHRIETPVGTVTATLHDDGTVTVANVPSYRHAAQVRVDVPGHGVVHGDVAWGGNWFFLCDDHGLPLEARRVAAADRVREAHARRAARAGRDRAGRRRDRPHRTASARPADPRNDARNFVLCPGGAYDRSPCGTGTSAKLACLAADGKLAPGAPGARKA